VLFYSLDCHLYTLDLGLVKFFVCVNWFKNVIANGNYVLDLFLSNGGGCNSGIRVCGIRMGILTVSGIRISSIAGVCDLRGGCVGNRGNNWGRCGNGVHVGSSNWGRCGNGVHVGSGNWGRGGYGVDVGSGSDFSMHVGSGSDISVNISLSSDICMNVFLSRDIFMNVCLSGNIFMNIRDSLNIFMYIRDSLNIFMNVWDSFDFFMNVGLGSNLGVDIRFSEGVDLAGIVVRVDYVVKCRGDGKRGGGNSGNVSVSSSVSRGSVCCVSSRDSCIGVTSISGVSSISSVVGEGSDDSGISLGGSGGNGQESRKSDLSKENNDKWSEIRLAVKSAISSG
jgi:hypothetical protein